MGFREEQEAKFKAKTLNPVSQEIDPKKASALAKTAAATMTVGTREHARYKMEMGLYAAEAERFQIANDVTNASILQNQQNIADAKDEYKADFGDKVNALFKTAYQSSPAAKAIGRLAVDAFKPSDDTDGEFSKVNTFEYRMQQLQANGLMGSSYNLDLLTGAKNKQNFEFYLQTLHTDDALARNSRFLTQGQNTVAGAIGAFSDPTYLMYAPAAAFKALSGATRLAGVMGSNSALQYTLSKMRDFGAPDRTMDDTLLDVAFGGIVDTFFGMRQLNKMGDMVAHDLGAAHLESVQMARTNAILNPSKYDFTTNYAWSAEKIGVKIPEQPVVSAEMRATEFVGGDGRGTVNESVKSLKDRLPKELKVTPEARAVQEARAVKEVTTYQLAKGAELEAKIASSGLSKEEFMKVSETLTADVSDLKDIIAGTIGDVKAQKNLLKDIYPLINHIGKVSPEAKASLEAEIEKALGVAKTPDKLVVKDGKTIAMAKGNKSFKEKTKQFDKRIKDAFTKTKQVFKETTDFKALKPITEGGALSAKELKQLATVQARISKLEHELTIAKLEADAAVIDAKLQKHDLEESVLLNKIEEFKTKRKDSVEYHLTKQKELYQRMSSVMDELVHDVNSEFQNLFKDILPTQVEKDLFAKSLSEDLGAILGQEIKVLEKDGQFIIANDLKFETKGDYSFIGKNKVLTATLLAMAGSTGAMADDGSSVTLSSAWFFVLMGAVGIVAFKAMKEHGGAMQVMKTFGQKAKGIQDLAIFAESDKGKAIVDTREQIVNAANFGVINSIEHVMKKGSQLSKDLAQRLGFDAVNPQATLNAMVSRNRYLREDMALFREAEEPLYKEWLKENKYNETFFNRLLSGGAETELREQFLNAVSDHIEFGKSQSKSVKELAKVMSDRMSLTAYRASDNGIIGFSRDTIGKISNYVPRIPKYDNIRQIVLSGGKEQLIDQIANAMAKPKGADPKEMLELAEKFVNGYADTGVKGVTQVKKLDDIINAMKKAGFDTEGIDVNQVAATLRNNNDAISRGKFRVDMDLSAFKPFKLTIDGIETTVDISHVYERNAGVLLQAHSSSVNGIVALKRATKGMPIGNGKVAENGIESEWAFREMISKEVDRTSHDILNSYVDSIMGHPIYDIHSEGAKFINNLRDLSYSRLVLTQFAMTSEYATSIQHMLESNTAFIQGMSHLKNLVRYATGKEGQTTALAKEIGLLTGMGTSVARRESSFKNLEGMYNVVEEQGHNALDKVGHAVKYLSLKASGILHADDAMKQISGIYHTERLAHLLQGKITMSANRMERYGVTPEFQQMFKDQIKLDDKNNLIEGFSKNWSDDMKDAYTNVIHRMIMTDSPEAIISSLPHSGLTSDAGRLLGFMTSFTAQSYTTKALAGIKRPDMRSFMETNIYFMGTYAGIYARDRLNGKETDDKELMYKAIMMMPLTSPYGIATMMADPMAPSIIGDSVTQMNRIQKDLIQ